MAQQARRFPSPRTGAPIGPQPAGLADPVAGGPNSFYSADIEHFCTRHTYSFFNTGKIKGANTFFAPGTGASELITDLEATIAQLRAKFAGEALPAVFQGSFTVNGKVVQIGWLPNGPAARA